MNRVYRALLVVLAFEMGAMLLYLPWSGYWEQNFFLSYYPSLIPVVLPPSFRGAVSGLGVLDILLALGWIGSRPGASRAPPQYVIVRPAPVLRDGPPRPAGNRLSGSPGNCGAENRDRGG